jgi:hypothetical protein
MSENSNSSRVGHGWLLFLVFLVLKLTHVIDWSWWWITAPLWGGLASFLGFLIIALFGVGVSAVGVGAYKKLKGYRDESPIRRIKF